MNKLTLKPTTEQQNIINLSKTGKNFVAVARAGCAKSSTLRMIVEQDVKPTLNICFNKANAEEADTFNMPNCKNSTFHSLAYKAIIQHPKTKMGKKLNGFLKFEEMESVIVSCMENAEKIDWFDNEGLMPACLQLKDIIYLFCQSAESSIQDFVGKLPEEYGVLLCMEYIADKYWKALINENNSFSITHDVYFKMWQLTKPLLLEYKRILLDEGQDTNPVCLDIFLNQKHAQLGIVGDEFQAIYEWRGAIDALSSVPDSFEKRYLTESFRYTQEIADIASVITKEMGDTHKIIGKNSKSLEDIKNPTKAIIVRNNITLLEALISAYNDGKKVKVFGDLKDLWAKLYHVQALMSNKQPKFPDKELSQYKNKEMLYKAADVLPEIAKLISFVKKLSREDGLYTAIQNISKVIVSFGYDYTITTAHKAKGLEWDIIELAEDLLPKPGIDISKEWLMENQNGNLLYVAVTRAKYNVIMPEKLEQWLEEKKDV